MGPRSIIAPLLGGILCLSACGENSVQPTAHGTSVVEGDGQAGRPGAPLPDSIAFVVIGPQGTPVAGVAVAFAASNGGTATPATDTTDPSGVVRTVWTLGMPEGGQWLVANAAGYNTDTATATAEAFHARAIASGDHHACALDEGGHAWCWSEGEWYAALGLGPAVSGTDYRIPHQVSGGQTFDSIYGYAAESCALDHAGAAWCWGADAGINWDTPTAVAAGTRFTSLSLSRGGAACGVAADGTLWCWGPTPTQSIGTPDAPINAAPGYHFVAVALGGFDIGAARTICGIDSSGAGWCWGSNGWGLLGTGDPDNTTAAAPRPIAGGYRFDQIELEAYAACGRSGEAVLCWGQPLYAGFGQESGLVTTPRQVPGVFARQIAAGDLATGVLTEAGELTLWGEDPYLSDRTQIASWLLPGLRDGVVTFDLMTNPTGYICGRAVAGAVYCSVKHNSFDWRMEGVARP